MERKCPLLPQQKHILWCCEWSCITTAATHAVNGAVSLLLYSNREAAS